MTDIVTDLPSDSGPDPSTSDTHAWRVPIKMTVLKGVGAVVFLVAAIIFGGDPTRLVLALLVAGLLGGFALRDILAPVRLAADVGGVTIVSGFARRRRLEWADIERVRLDSRRHWGRRTELVEIDTGESLHLFSAAELGAPCDEVVETLVRLRTGR